MPTKQKNSNEVTREEFIAALKKAKTKVGGAYNLSIAFLPLKAQDRRIFKWMRGEGPTKPKMQKLYARLKEILCKAEESQSSPVKTHTSP